MGRTRNADTTKANMGRRKNPPCGNPRCRLRVDKLGDQWCRLCKWFAGDREVQVHGSLPRVKG